MILNKRQIFYFFFLLLISLKCLPQTENEKVILIENTTSSNLFNGLAFNDTYRVLSKKNRYLNDEIEYQIGDVTIDGFLYKNIELKYDLYKDNLILKPMNNSGYIGILLDKEKIKSFYIKKQLFINSDYFDLSKNKSIKPGFYEIKYKSKNITLYVKHTKNIKELLNKNIIHYEYNLEYEIVIIKDSLIYKIENKNNLVKIFPEFKKRINSYFRINQKLEKEDKATFYKNLLLSIDQK